MENMRLLCPHLYREHNYIQDHAKAHNMQNHVSNWARGSLLQDEARVTLFTSVMRGTQMEFQLDK